MSGQASGWVWKHGPKLTTVGRDGLAYGQRARGLRAVLGVIADAANVNGEHSHPGNQTICDSALYGKRQVAALIAELIAEGWLVIEEEGGGRGKATVYAIPGVRAANDETMQPPQGSDDPEPRGPEPETARSDAETARSDAKPRGGMPSDQHVRDANGLYNGVKTNGRDQRAPSSASPPTDDTPRRLSNLLADCIAHRGCKRPAVSAVWVQDMERLIRIDGREPDAIERVLFWLHRGTDRNALFWQPNIRSPRKLREKWDQMFEQYRNAQRSNGAAGNDALQRLRDDLARARATA